MEMGNVPFMQMQAGKVQSAWQLAIWFRVSEWRQQTIKILQIRLPIYLESLQF